MTLPCRLLNRDKGNMERGTRKRVTTKTDNRKVTLFYYCNSYCSKKRKENQDTQ